MSTVVGVFIWNKMALIPTNIDYTDKDFESLKARLQNLITSVFPDWTDFNVASFGNILLELFAFVGEIFTFYQDNQARESRIVTATQRKNVIALAKLLGYKLSGARAATADVQFTLALPPIADVIFAAGTVVRTQEVTEPVRFQLLNSLMIAAGLDPPEVMATVEHSETRDELFESTGLSNQQFQLSFTPYLDDSAMVSAGNGIYTEVENLLNSGPNDLHYTVVVDQNDRASIRFGDNLQGAIPTGTIQVIYKTGGGPEGNVDAERIVVIEGAYCDAFGNPVQVSVINPSPASGGVPRQSLASAKVLAPASLRTLNRTVSREDYENNALKLIEVARALMLTSNEDPTIGENSGILFVIPQGGGLPSQQLKDQVEHQVTVVYPNTLTFALSVQNPVYRTINVTATVFLHAGSNPTKVRDDIEQTLVGFFAISNPDGTANRNVDFGFNIKDAEGNPGGEVAWSNVLAVVEAVPGVRKIGDEDADFLLNGKSDDVLLLNREFPVLGQITLISGSTGQQL